MSLTYALEAAINGPTGPRATLSHGLSRAEPHRRRSGPPGFSFLTGGRSGRPGTLLRKCERRPAFARERWVLVASARRWVIRADAASGRRRVVGWRQSFRRLWVAVISRHSERQAALPRRWKRSILRLNLVSAKTGSIIAVRLP